MSTPRWLNVALGAWLFISAFVWRHGAAQFQNSWIMGIIMVGLALLAGGYPWARFLNAGAAVYLFFSTLLLPRVNAGTVWHNCILAVLVFIISLAPARVSRFQPTRPQA